MLSELPHIQELPQFEKGSADASSAQSMNAGGVFTLTLALVTSQCGTTSESQLLLSQYVHCTGLLHQRHIVRIDVAKTNYLITDFTSGEDESMPISSCEDDKYEPTLSRSLNNVQHSIKKITKTTCNTVLPIHSQCAECSTYFELFQAKKEKVTDNFCVTSP